MFNTMLRSFTTDIDLTMSWNKLYMPFSNIVHGRLCYSGSLFVTLHRVMVSVKRYWNFNFVLTFNTVSRCKLQVCTYIICSNVIVFVFRLWWIHKSIMQKHWLNETVFRNNKRPLHSCLNNNFQTQVSFSYTKYSVLLFCRSNWKGVQ